MILHVPHAEEEIVNPLVYEGYGLGYIPDFSRSTDRRYTMHATSQPSKSPPLPLQERITNQGALGKCTGASVADAEEIVGRILGVTIEWSNIWPYLLGRLALQGFTLEQYRANPSGLRPRLLADTGAMIRDVVRGLNRYGAISEALHSNANDHYADLPTDLALAQAYRHLAFSCEQVETSIECKDVLLPDAGQEYGRPVVIGFSVPTNFHEARTTGRMPVPSGFAGGHAVIVVQYDDDYVFPEWGVRGGFKIKNSWGAEWGAGGYFWMPYKFFDSSHVSDSWAIQGVKA